MFDNNNQIIKDRKKLDRKKNIMKTEFYCIKFCDRHTNLNQSVKFKNSEKEILINGRKRADNRNVQ